MPNLKQRLDVLSKQEFIIKGHLDMLQQQQSEFCLRRTMADAIGVLAISLQMSYTIGSLVSSLFAPEVKGVKALIPYAPDVMDYIMDNSSTTIKRKVDLKVLEFSIKEEMVNKKLGKFTHYVKPLFETMNVITDAVENYEKTKKIYDDVKEGWNDSNNISLSINTMIERSKKQLLELQKHEKEINDQLKLNNVNQSRFRMP